MPVDEIDDLTRVTHCRDTLALPSAIDAVLANADLIWPKMPCIDFSFAFKSILELKH